MHARYQLEIKLGRCATPLPLPYLAGARPPSPFHIWQVLDLLDATDNISGSMGEQFLQATADEISKRARRRVQLVKERQDLQKIVEYVSAHNDSLRRKNAAFKEYLESVRPL